MAPTPIAPPPPLCLLLGATVPQGSITAYQAKTYREERGKTAFRLRMLSHEQENCRLDSRRHHNDRLMGLVCMPICCACLGTLTPAVWRNSDLVRQIIVAMGLEFAFTSFTSCDCQLCKNAPFYFEQIALGSQSHCSWKHHALLLNVRT